MTTRQRIGAGTGQSAGGGGGPAPTGNLQWGPDFGNPPEMEVGVSAPFLSVLALTANKIVGVNVDLWSLTSVYTNPFNVGVHADLLLALDGGKTVGVNGDLQALAANYVSEVTGTPGGTYPTAAKDFDGVDDVGTRGADLTGATDQQTGVLSFWINRQSTATTRSVFASVTALGGTVRRGVQLQLAGGTQPDLILNSNAGGQSIRHIAGTAPLNTWAHVIYSWDKATDTSLCYLNDAAAGTPSFTAGALDTTWPDWRFGGSAGVFHDSCISEFYFHLGTFLDLTVEANRRKFITAALEAVDLGADGSTPLGVQPLVYFKAGDPSTNSGSGGNFTLAGGGLADCASAPPGEPTGGGFTATGLVGGITADLDALRLAHTKTCGAHCSGSVLGAPFLQSVSSAATTTNVTSFDIPTPAGTVDGDLLVAVVASGLDTYVTPSGWTLIRHDTGTNLAMSSFYKVASGEGANLTFSGPGTSQDRFGTVFRIVGFDTGTPVNVSGGQTGSAADPVAPSITTTVANTLLICACVQRPLADQTFTPPAGYTERSDLTATFLGLVQVEGETATRLQTTAAATGTATMDSTGLTAQNYAAQHIAVAPGAYTVAS